MKKSLMFLCFLVLLKSCGSKVNNTDLASDGNVSEVNDTALKVDRSSRKYSSNEYTFSNTVLDLDKNNSIHYQLAKQFDADTTFKGPYEDRTTPAGLFYGFVRYDSVILHEIRKKGRIVYVIGDYYLSVSNPVSYCSFYYPSIYTEDFVLLERGCGFPPNWDSKMVFVSQDSFDVFPCGKLVEVNKDTTKAIFTRTNTIYPLYVMDLKERRITDTLRFDKFFNKDLGRVDPYFLGNFDAIDSTSQRIFRFKEDTIFFKFWGEPGFMILGEGR